MIPNCYSDLEIGIIALLMPFALIGLVIVIKNIIKYFKPKPGRIGT